MWGPCFVFLLILFLGQDDAVKVASNKIAKYYAYIYAKYFRCMCLPERNRHAEVIERVCHAVGKAADDEERNSEQKREILLFTCELHRGSHDESASYSQKSAPERPCTETKLKDFLSGSLDLERSHSRQKRSDEASYYITGKNHEQLPYLTFIDEASGSCIKLQFISDNGQEAERKENGTGKRTIRLSLDTGSKEAESGCSDGDTGKYG